MYYITSTYYTIVKQSNFNTYDPQHSKSEINNQTFTNNWFKSIINNQTNQLNTQHSAKKQKKCIEMWESDSRETKKKEIVTDW